METELTNIKDLSVADRPREKLLQSGAATLSNKELMAIILRSGSKSYPVVTICQALVDLTDNNLSALAALSVDEIAAVKGVGEVKAITLLAAIELGKRSQKQTKPLNLKNDLDVEQFISSYISIDKVAQYHLVLINNQAELLATSKLQTEKHQLPDLKKILTLSIESGAHEIILCRNDIKLPARVCDQEKAFIIQLDAAASMLKIKMRGLLLIQK